ncbi:UNVERIFIED_CONTAM: GDSL esterase/lipase [Sesamum calycinum]|uniref:GDSL esterase/lipase n=1 Tax=Sesamum calycinum TaxID=2727403 RepID=A0AAW2Q5B9_9LAMI
MASVFHKLVLVLCCFLFSCVPQWADAHPLSRFASLIRFTNSVTLFPTPELDPGRPIGATAFARLPYGETFFKKATGRCSNGLLMIDYIAMDAGLPFLPPYKNLDAADFEHGVNFAVAGSTALPSQVLAAQHIFSPVTNSSLNVQLEWMFTHFNSICLNSRDCVEKLQNALFMVGEIGGNDYNYAIFQGKTMEELKAWCRMLSLPSSMLPGNRSGGKRVVIPGNFPIGCLPIYKTAFQTNISAAYDENQCLNHLNEFAKYHNEELQKAIHTLKQRKPNAVVVYADYYNAYQFLLKVATSHGFEREKACCGTGGKYNFNMMRMCGGAGVEVCSHPERYMSWDGVHLTEKGYKIMAAWLLNNIFPHLLCHF